MNEYRNGKLLNFKPIQQWDAQTQSYREPHCSFRELKDEFNKVILEIEANPDKEHWHEMKPEGVDKGWIEALTFAITCINTKMKEENA